MARAARVTAEYIKELQSHLKTKFQTRDTRIEEIRKARSGTEPPWIPPEHAAKNRVEPFIYRLVWDYLRRATSILGTEFPSPTVHPNEAKDQANSTKREAWLSAAYPRLFKNDAYAQGLDALVETTEAWWKVWEARHGWSAGTRQEGESNTEYVERVSRYQQAHFPFRAEHVDSATVRPIFDNEGLAEVLEVTKREALPIARQFTLSYEVGAGWRKGRFGEKITGTPATLEWVEYWNRDEYVYLADGEIIRRGRHSYGRVPYFYARSIITSSKDPSDLGMGFAYPLITLQKTLSSIITMWMNWGLINAYPQEVQQAQSEDAMPILGPVTPIEPDERGRVIVPAGWQLGYRVPPGLGGELEKLHSILKGYADEMTLARILQGDLSSSNVSGVAAQLMLAVAKSIFGPGLKAVCRAFDEIAVFLQQRIELSIQEPVPVWEIATGENGTKPKRRKGQWLALGPSDIKGYYQVEHDLDPIIPAEQMSKVLMYNDGVARNLLPNRIAIEQGYLFHNPEEIEIEAYIDNLKKSPQVQMMVVNAAQEKLRAQLGLPTGGGVGTQVGQQASPPIGPGGPGVPQVAGVQQPLAPGAPMGPAPEAPGGIIG